MMVTASYAIPHSSIVTILNEIGKASQMNSQLKESIQQMPKKRNPSYETYSS